MKISRDEVLKSLDDIFNYCEEIDNSLPENERSGYKMLPDIQKIREYIIENTRQHGEWEYTGCVNDSLQSEFCCSICDFTTYFSEYNFCPNCGADMRKEGESE